MAKRLLGSGLAIVLVAQAGAVQAVPSGVAPSAFVRCDGAPNKPSTLGTVARLVAITAVIGLLLPDREGADPKKREAGEAGIKACDEALSGPEPAKDGGRRIELLFGRAIHRMEVNDWDGALADIRSVTTDQPALTATPEYAKSLGLTALNLEAMALVGKGEVQQAHEIALKMADQAPYDLINMLQVIDYMRLSEVMGPDKARYLDQLARVYPAAGLVERAAERAAARDFAGAADDYSALSALWRSVPVWKNGTYPWDGRAAIALRLAGKAAEADTLMAAARKEADEDKASGRTKVEAASAEMASAVDFYEVIRALDDGKAMRARSLFSARTDWGSLTTGFTAELARRLQMAGTPAEQANTPIPTPAEIFDRRRSATVARINNPGTENTERFSLYRPAFGATDFNRFTSNVWYTAKSRYLDKKIDEEVNATWISTARNGQGVPGGYAMLLHLALLAKAQGQTGFWLLPGQRHTFQHFVRIGSPGQAGMIEPVMYNADKVIADLSPLFPRPVSK